MNRPKLSVNINKVATLRNSRGGRIPSVLAAVEVCVDAGAPGITVHPRADERHIRASDAREVSSFLGSLRSHVEFNVEGDPRPDLIALVEELQPDQCTLVPVRAGELTSEAGWPDEALSSDLARVIARIKAAAVRVSLFVNPVEAPIRWAADHGADRVELYTEPFARAFEESDQAGQASFAQYARASELAASLGLGVNAGHDLDLDNLRLFRGLPHLAEVSIGHALISRALFVGLHRAVRDYLGILADRT